MLLGVERYCRIWGLKINTNKTKAMIFEKGRHTRHDFYIYDTPIEVVDSFKYLGITSLKNGNQYRTQKSIAEHASFARYIMFLEFLTTLSYLFLRNVEYLILLSVQYIQNFLDEYYASENLLIFRYFMVNQAVSPSLL